MGYYNPVLPTPSEDPAVWIAQMQADVQARFDERAEIINEENANVQEAIVTEAHERMEYFRSLGFECPPDTTVPYSVGRPKLTRRDLGG